MNHYIRISFKSWLVCILFLSLTSKSFSQDTTQLRLERFDSLLHKLIVVRTNTHKMISMYKKYRFITPETLKELTTKAEQFDKLLKIKTTPEHGYIRKLGDTYDDLTQQIYSIYDSVHPTARIPKTKNVVTPFFDSWFKAENVIDFYDELNYTKQDLFFRNYRPKSPGAF